MIIEPFIYIYFLVNMVISCCIYSHGWMNNREPSKSELIPALLFGLPIILWYGIKDLMEDKNERK